ncbi:MAG TPA: hypothetical protein VGL70_06370 [Candidatus Binatia bacterium]|jgi:hypothetical protein
MNAHKWRHLIFVFVICLATAVLYANVTRAYFCAYDDFLEIHRAAFEDSRDPSRIFTTPHFNSPKYRPLNRLLSLWTYRAGEGSPLLFRIRNLAFHLINVALVYALGWLLFASTPVSVAAAAWFGLHPLANQPVIGALWANTIAHTGFLLAIVTFIVSLRAKRWALWLSIAIISGWLALLTYDSSVVVFPLMAVYLIIYVWLFQRRILPRGFLIACCGLTAALMAAYLVLRVVFVSQGWSQAAKTVPAPWIVVKNIAMYLFALLSPLDSVLANEWLNLPLPSEIDLDNFILAAAALVVLLAIGLAAAVRYAVKHPELFRNLDRAAIAFLVSAIALPLLPVLLFASHPSETYLYLSVAFYALLLAYALGRAIDAMPIPGKETAYAVAVLFFAAILSAATWTRNERVLNCATTAKRIIRALPAELSTGARWTVSFAPAPESRRTPYGFYAHRGIYTLGDDDGAITAALQFVYGNTLLAAKLIEPERSAEGCRNVRSARRLCLMVYGDGRMEALGAAPADEIKRIPVGVESNRSPLGGIE